MIALVNLIPESARAAGVESLTSLPAPPALRWSGFLIRCMEQPPLGDVAQWCAAMRKVRPIIPIGLVIRPDPDALQWLASSDDTFAPVLGPEDVPGGRVGYIVIEHLRENSIEARVVEHWQQQYGSVDVDGQRVLCALASHAVRGERLKKARASVDGSSATLARHLQDWGYPPPGVLMRDGRITSVQIRIELGIEPRIAREAAGWQSAKTYAKARKRLRDDAKWGGTPHP